MNKYYLSDLDDEDPPEDWSARYMSWLAIPVLVMIGIMLTLHSKAADKPVDQTVYKCTPGYEPPCRKVLVSPGASNPLKIDQAQANEAAIAMMTGAWQPVKQCQSSHGASSCCHIIGTDPSDGSVFVECGNP